MHYIESLMKQKAKRNIHVHIIKHLREMHRLLGIWLAFILIFLAVSGILINHGNSLLLDSRHVGSRILLDHYGVKAPASIEKYRLSKTTDDNVVYVIDDQVWTDNGLLMDSEQSIVAITPWQELIVVLTSHKLYLYTMDFELVDVLDQLTGLPSGIKGISFVGESVYLQTREEYWLSDDQLYSWQATQAPTQPAVVNQVKTNLLTDEKAQLSLQYRTQFLTWEQVILDLHSGRFFGQFGVLFMDFLAILIIVLSITGIYIWVRQARARRR